MEVFLFSHTSEGRTHLTQLGTARHVFRHLGHKHVPRVRHPVQPAHAQIEGLLHAEKDVESRDKGAEV